MSVTCLFQYTGIRIFNDHTCEQRIICSTRSVYIFLEKKTPFSPNIIFYYITAPHLNKKYVAPGRQNLAGEFCVVGGEFSDLRCLMNTLYYIVPTEVCRTNFKQYQGPRLWNPLPHSIIESDSIRSFKWLLKSYLVNLQNTQ